MECRHVIGDVVQRSRGSRKRYSVSGVWCSKGKSVIPVYFIVLVLCGVLERCSSVSCASCSSWYVLSADGSVAGGRIGQLWLPHRYPVVLQR